MRPVLLESMQMMTLVTLLLTTHCERPNKLRRRVHYSSEIATAFNRTHTPFYCSVRPVFGLWATASRLLKS